MIMLKKTNIIGWLNVWMESDSQISLQCIMKDDLIHWDLRNISIYCRNLRINRVYTHTY